MIHVIREKATAQQIQEMLEEHDYIKLAVDIHNRIVAGGGEYHADCEEMLLDNGSQQADVWGADWDPTARLVRFRSLINIRPKQNNRSQEIEDSVLRQNIETIVRERFA